jgi:DNA-binding NtrC family response regulator
MILQPTFVARGIILIVDDDAAARRQLRTLLSANSYWAIEAGNGRIARQLLALQEIDLVVSDIFMPECDGFELIAAIRAMEHPVPVIALSDHESWTGPNFFDAANDLGATAVIEKPFRAQVLLRLIDDALLAEKRSQRGMALGAVAECEHNPVPAGLEWVGAHRADV